MKKDSLTTKALTFLYKAGLLYKSDFSMYMYANSSTANAAKTISFLLKQEYIKTRHIENNNVSKHYEEAVELTRTGKDKLLEIVNDKSLKKNDRIKKFQTNDTKTIKRRLEENTVLTFFSMNDVKVFKQDKPTLEELYTKYFKELRQESNNGIYYSKSEYIDFLKNNEDFKFIDLTKIRTSKFMGIYISYKNCYVIYSCKRGNDRLFRVKYNSEKEVLFSLTRLTVHTDVNRSLFGLSQTTMNGKETVHNSPQAIVIANGNSFVYTMTLGEDNGLIKDDNPVATLAYKKDKESDIIFYGVKDDYKTVFDAYSGIYKHIYVAPRNMAGVLTINYLINNTVEKWHKESIELFKTNPKYFIESDDYIYPARELVDRWKISATYIPVYDIMMFRKISELDFVPTIVTNEEMIETIAHATRRCHRFYDSNFYLDNTRKVARLFDEDATYIYDIGGYPEGYYKIKKNIENEGQEEVDKSIYSKLPKMFGYESKISFYNDIARNIIYVDDVIEKIELQDKVIKPKMKLIKITSSKEFIEMIKTLAKNENKSVSKFLYDITYEQIEKDYKERNKAIADMRRFWKEYER